MTLIAKKPVPPSDLIYLSSPYSHPDFNVRHARYRAALITVAHYLHQGIYLYSPILHNHPIVCYRDLPDASVWLEYDYAVLSRCSSMWVLRIPGHNTSLGVRAESEFCTEHGISWDFIDPPFDKSFSLGSFVDFGGPDGR